MFITTFELIVIVFFVNFFIPALVMFFFNRKLRQKEKRLALKETGLRDRSEKIMESCRKKSEDILKNALKQSSGIIRHSGIIREDLEKNFKNILEKAATDHLQDFETDLMMEDEKIKTLRIEEREVVKKSSDEEIKKMDEYVKNKIDEQLQAESEKIRIYKESRLKNVEAEINEMIKKISLDVIGKALPISEQERLVIESLEKAKNEGII